MAKSMPLNPFKIHISRYILSKKKHKIVPERRSAEVLRIYWNKHFLGPILRYITCTDDNWAIKVPRKEPTNYAISGYVKNPVEKAKLHKKAGMIILPLYSLQTIQFRKFFE
jgi:hypothetical protein